MISLKELRKGKGLTQVGLANKLGLPPAYGQKVVSQWESGIRSPTDKEVAAICKIFKIVHEDLLVRKTDLSTAFTDCLFQNGMEQSDIKFILENTILHRPAVKALQELCAELRGLRDRFERVIEKSSLPKKR